MHRRTFIKNSSLAFGALTVAQQQILSAFVQEPWKITLLRTDIGIYEEKGGTIAFFLSKKGIVVVDAQYPDQSKHLIDELKKRTPPTSCRPYCKNILFVVFFLYIEPGPCYYRITDPPPNLSGPLRRAGGFPCVCDRRAQIGWIAGGKGFLGGLESASPPMEGIRFHEA